MNQATKSRKKVLYLITKATVGGAQKYVYDLATNIPKDLYEPVVTYGEPGKLSKDLAHAGITTYQVPSLGRDVALFSDIKSFWKILKGLRKGRPDVVHLNSSKAAAIGALAARMAGIKNIIFTVHGWPFGERRNVLARLLIWNISWLTALLSRHVICVSDYDLRVAKNMPFVGKKARRIYNGISSIQFGSGDVIRNKFPAGVKILGTVGELTKNKNHIALIEQARQHSDMHVAIVGEGELRNMLEQKIKEYGIEARVKLFGFLPSSEVLKGFDVFVLPSIKEGLPYVLLEARQAGLPIEANRVGGVGEILDAKDMSEFSLTHMLESTTALYR
ncbi:glycosyltransferase [Candidatus Parcubacteria bacterium]|nr:MAG: glycosyltransferase [Candidatus Parcubacteria bacterium]